MSTTDARHRNVKVDGELKLNEDTKLLLRDSGVFLQSETDGCLTIEADTSVKIVNPENQVDGTLTGTPLLIKVTIGATPYYLKVYPTVS